MIDLDVKINEISKESVATKNDFDFINGTWEVENTRWTFKLNDFENKEEIKFHAKYNVRPLLGGHGQVDRFVTQNVNATTLRLFDPKTNLWSLYWLTNHNPKIGKPHVGTMYHDFWGKILLDGNEIVTRYVWSETNTDIPMWEQYVLVPNEDIKWVRNWKMLFRRLKLEEF